MNPKWQREMLKAHSKASMGGQPMRTEALQQGLAREDIDRKNQFRGLALQKKRSDLSHKYRKHQYKMEKKELSHQKKMLPWTIALGGGTALVSALEGRSRANRIGKAEAASQARHDEMMGSLRGNYEAQRRRMGVNRVGRRRGL